MEITIKSSFRSWFYELAVEILIFLVIKSRVKPKDVLLRINGINLNPRNPLFRIFYRFFASNFRTRNLLS